MRRVVQRIAAPRLQLGGGAGVRVNDDHPSHVGPVDLDGEGPRVGRPRHRTAAQVADEPGEDRLVTAGKAAHHQVPAPGEGQPLAVGTDRDPLAVADPFRRAIREDDPVQRSGQAHPEPKHSAIGGDRERIDGFASSGPPWIGHVAGGADHITGRSLDLDDPPVEAEHGEERPGRAEPSQQDGSWAGRLRSHRARRPAREATTGGRGPSLRHRRRGVSSAPLPHRQHGVQSPGNAQDPAGREFPHLAVS